MKSILIFFFSFLILLIIIYFLKPQSGIRTKNLSINGHQLIVEVADTDSLRTQGLSGRRSLARNQGMLFNFPAKGFYQFWMKDMLIALDFIWLNNGKVVDLTENVQSPQSSDERLPTYTARYPFEQVIEVNAGVVKSLNIAIGDVIH